VQELDVANYLHQRYGALDEQERESGSGGGGEDNAGDNDDNGPASSAIERIKSVTTAGAFDTAARQHGQDTPLLLGKTPDDNVRLPGEVEMSMSGRRLSFSSSMKLKCAPCPHPLRNHRLRR
jgi:hypothetical protein